MHRHGYKGRKFKRVSSQRKAMIRSLVSALIEHGSIETTLPKAKEIRPFAEKLVTKAKKGGLHNRRQVYARLNDEFSTNILFDEIVPLLEKRNSGYLRIEKTSLRRGDLAQMARISFVDDLSAKPKPKTPVKLTRKSSVKKPTAKTALKKTSMPKAVKTTVTRAKPNQMSPTKAPTAKIRGNK